MAFQTPITIRRAVEHVRCKEYVLPAIQRELVWNSDQITRLFDSLMRDYPISSFLFWRVDRDSCRKYKFYAFLDRYHERDEHHNQPLELTGVDGVTAVLDGQQRLTALHIGLRGSYTFKTKYKRWNAPNTFPLRRLYLNLLRPASGEEVELKYDFCFLTDAEAQVCDDVHWFPVGDVLNFESLRDINRYLREHDLLGPEHPEDCLYMLYEAICKKPLINYYLEEDQDPDKVLNIFIRINSGGTKLSYSDLLLSIATAQWKHIDARQAIHGLVDDLNRTGEGFSFNKDFVLKSCLVLADIGDIGFKVKNFTRANTVKIESAWPQISDALRAAVRLASRFGYNGRTLTASNVLVSIAYYLLIRQLTEGYLERRAYAADRDAVQEWIARALLKTGTFGSGLDTTLRTARATIQEHRETFPVQQLDTAFAKIGKALRFEEEELDDLLDQTYGNTLTFSVLALLYPGVDLANRFHEDHIFPRSRFTERRLLNAGVSEDEVPKFRERRDRIANLQLLEGIINEEKSSKMPAEWLQSHFTSSKAVEEWKLRNYTDNVPEDMNGFLKFYRVRREGMKLRLAQLLGVTLSR